jgi:hypothetical protein
MEVSPHVLDASVGEILVSQSRLHLCKAVQSHVCIPNKKHDTLSRLHIRHVPKNTNSLTALTSPKFPFRAKCALKLALALPAHTPQSARSTLERLNTMTRSGFGNAGLRQSITIAVSFKTSAARRYILHSGSRAVPSRCANRMVPMRPADSWSTERRSAVVGDAVESPTPTPRVSIC